MKKERDSKIKENLTQTLSKIFNFNFSDDELIRQAVTRRSAISEKVKYSSSKTFQRLEFLGDSILNHAVAEMLFVTFPDSQEEELTLLRSLLVRNDNLGQVADELKLGQFLIIGKGEEQKNIRTNKKALADLIESLIAVVFLTSGLNWSITKKVILNFLKPVVYSNGLFLKNKEQIDRYYNILLSDSKELVSKNGREMTPEGEYPTNNVMSSCHEDNWKVDYSVNNIAYVSEVIDIEKLKEILLSKDKQEIECKLSAFILCAKHNPTIELEFAMIEENEDEMISLLEEHPDSTNSLIEVLGNYMAFHIDNLNVKEHYFCSKLLLILLSGIYKKNPSLGYDDNFMLNLAYCIMHNGIVFYHHNHLDHSRNYLYKALKMLSVINPSADPELFSISQWTCLAYYGEVAYLLRDYSCVVECLQMIRECNSLPIAPDELKLSQLNKIGLYEFLLKSNPSYEELVFNVEQFTQQLMKLPEHVKRKRIYIDELMKTREILYKSHLNTLNFEVVEKDLAKYEDTIIKLFGDDCIILCRIYDIHISKILSGVKSFFSKNEELVLMRLVHKSLRLITCNYPVTSRIYLQCWEIYHHIMQKYVKLYEK